MKKVTKNTKFHQQVKGEKIKEVAIILLLNDSNNKIIYDITCCKTNEQLQQRIKEININNVTGLCYVAVTNSIKFIEYKRIQIINNR